ncbi:MAG: 50S ribosomal protein L10 [Ignavibacteriae bacterium]|nr:50S ribosomal protein L10 [Ignavibacteriota bacterium]MCB0725132.1 50S ribosomal protein L10 [Ignavibacteriota bacterium]MCB9242544.1 50S ribosomal protein L10 [Ignavibacteriales bacterium]
MSEPRFTLPTGTADFTNKVKMDKQQKADLTNELKDMFDNAGALYMTDFTGMTVADVEQLRDEFYKANVKYRVVKNTLALRALKESDKYSEFSDKFAEFLKGPTSIAFSDDDPIAPAKILKKFFDDKERPVFKMAMVENEFYGSDKLKQLASLQSKEELIGGIIYCINYPITGIVGAINSTMRDLFSVIEEVAKKQNN